MNLRIISLMALVLWSMACGRSKGVAGGGVIVSVVEADYRGSSAGKEFPFISKPFRSSELSFRVGGPVLELDVYVGGRYAKGQTIARIDDRDFVIRRERSEAVYTQARAEYERTAALFEKNSISRSALDRALAECTSARVALETATNELGDTRLVAPFDGYVGEVFVEKFQDVRPTERVVTFVELDKLKIEAYVTQDVAFGAGGLRDVSLCFDADPGREYGARVVEVSRSTTSNNLSYLLTAELDNVGGGLLAGMSGRVSFDMGSGGVDSTVVVAQGVLCHRPTVGDYVWVVDPVSLEVSCRRVRLGELLPGGMVAVEQGLSKGEMVAGSSLRFLSEGMVVQIKGRQQENAAAGDSQKKISTDETSQGKALSYGVSCDACPGRVAPVDCGHRGDAWVSNCGGSVVIADISAGQVAWANISPGESGKAAESCTYNNFQGGSNQKRS